MEIIVPDSTQNNQIDSNQLGQKNLFLKFINTINSFIFELVLIVLFSTIILTTFNYFNLIPISSVFPVLSFLPQQNSTTQKIINAGSQNDIAFFNNNISNLSACDPIQDENIILNPIITCKNPTKITNTGKESIYINIPNTDDVSDYQIQINFGLKIIQGNNYSPSGIMFGGGPKENRMYISYDNNSNSWGVQFLYSDIITPFENLYTTTSSSIQRVYFSVTISKDGKQINILSPNGLIQAYSLKGSLYTKENKIPATAVVSPNSEVDIYSLNYYTPQ